MRDDFRKPSLLILAVTAAGFSRGLFALFHDPEGPNLLVVAGLAAILYLASLAGYLSRLGPSLTGAGRCLAAIVIQLLVATGIYVALR